MVVVGTWLAIYSSMSTTTTTNKEYTMKTKTAPKKHDAPVTWPALLHQAVNTPGHAAKCYSMFHNYSFGNQLLALWQMTDRGIDIGPIATFKKWKSLGRSVRKGSKAMLLCVPVKARRTIENELGEKETIYITVGFDYKCQWFAVAQTDGEDVQPDPVPGWDLDRAMRNLKIERVNFDMVNGNCQGYAHKRTVALNPVAQHATRTMLHELAHVALGHTDDMTTSDEARTPRNVAELEAEAVAYLLCDTFNLGGQDESRNYIQNWYKENTVPDENAQRIFKVAQQILAAGKEDLA